MPQAIHAGQTLNLDLLGHAASLQRRFEALASLAQRKGRGQFGTPPSVAAFMARLLSTPARHFRVLDPGAGTGTLSAAVCERIASLKFPVRLEFVLYEAEPRIRPLLEACMQRCRDVLRDAGHEMSYTILSEDYVLANRPRLGQELLFDDGAPPEAFDAVIMNPPYFKLNKQSAHARAFEHVVHGQPNIYALFMTTAAAMLKAGGELVAITPRSFCNGLYFREFRRWFLERMQLRHVHLFESRTETFKGADVLQESIITSWRKETRRRRTVTLSSSFGADIAEAQDTAAHPTSRIVDAAHSDFVIRIPSSRTDGRIMDLVESWRKRFADHQLQVSTGPVVMFRAAQYLLPTVQARSVPLILPHQIQPFDTQWPLPKPRKPLAFRVCAGSARLLLPLRNYVLLRRFSAKEERRRLTASCVLHNDDRWPSQLAIENHVNYVYHARRDLSEVETYGLAALFNSALLDRYFRVQSGNTQVNATEIRAMPFPDLEDVAEIGGRVIQLGTIGPAAAEQIVLAVLGIDGAIARELTRTIR